MQGSSYKNGTPRGKAHLNLKCTELVEVVGGIVWCQQGRGNDCMLLTFCTPFWQVRNTLGSWATKGSTQWVINMICTNCNNMTWLGSRKNTLVLGGVCLRHHPFSQKPSCRGSATPTSGEALVLRDSARQMQGRACWNRVLQVGGPARKSAEPWEPPKVVGEVLRKVPATKWVLWEVLGKVHVS